MELEIKLKKGNPSILTVVRPDGSKTWTRLKPGMEIHELAHIAVEEVLQLDKGFYGLIAQGHNVGDFELPRGERPEELIPRNLPPESIVCEHIVNLLQTESMNMGEKLDILSLLREIVEEKDLPFPSDLTDEQLDKIRQAFGLLQRKWLIIPSAEIFSYLLQLPG